MLRIVRYNRLWQTRSSRVAEWKEKVDKLQVASCLKSLFADLHLTDTRSLYEIFKVTYHYLLATGSHTPLSKLQVNPDLTFGRVENLSTNT
jgi:hypothetical protein